MDAIASLHNDIMDIPCTDFVIRLAQTGIAKSVLASGTHDLLGQWVMALTAPYGTCSSLHMQVVTLLFPVIDLSPSFVGIGETSLHYHLQLSIAAVG